MPGHIMKKFEQWGEDNLIVVRIVGHVEFCGTPIFLPLPYGRWHETEHDQLVTLTYYPPFSTGADPSETHLLIRSPTPITDLTVQQCTPNSTTAGTMTYKEWTTAYSNCTDTHLKTVSINKVKQ